MVLKIVKNLGTKFQFCHLNKWKTGGKISCSLFSDFYFGFKNLNVVSIEAKELCLEIVFCILIKLIDVHYFEESLTSSFDFSAKISKINENLIKNTTITLSDIVAELARQMVGRTNITFNLMNEDNTDMINRQVN